MDKLHDNTGNSYKILLCIFVAGSMAMIIAAKFDIQWTQFFQSNQVGWYAKFMNEAYFSWDKQLGAVDFVYCLLVIPGTILYILSWLFCLFSGNKQLLALMEKIISIRPYLGFLITSTFCSAVLFVHTTKQVVGRARPDAILSGIMPYSEWSEFGPHFITQGSFSGSFPSGHTATASILIAFAYIVLDVKRNKQWLGWMLLGFSLMFAGGMGIARMMSASHWATDVVFTVFACWTIIHVIFYWGLRVPAQIDYFCRHGKHKISKPIFELQICLNMFFLCLGVWALFTGIRSADMTNWPWLQVLIPLGLSSIFFYSKIIWRIGFFRKKALADVNPELGVGVLTRIAGNIIDA